MTTSVRLFKRACTVQVGALLIPANPSNGLRVSFNVKRGVQVTAGAMKPRPNTCDLKIWNLTADHQRQVSQAAGAGPIPCILSAGYEGASVAIFNGQLRAGNTIRDGSDNVTEISTGDGDLALQQRLNLALGTGASAKQAIRAIVSGLGIGDGNLARAEQMLEASPLAAQLYVRGAVLKGSAADIMTDFCRSVGLSWSIQNGALQVTQAGQPLDGQALLIDAAHGMIGSPTVDTKGVLSVTTLMIPGVVPGTRLSMNAEHVVGNYRVMGVETVGDTFEAEWYHRIEGLKI